MAKNETIITALEDTDRVEIYIPKGSVNDEPNLLISVNGSNYLLPKGKTSRVPVSVAYEYERSLKAQTKLDATIDALTSLSNQ